MAARQDILVLQDLLRQAESMLAQNERQRVLLERALSEAKFLLTQAGQKRGQADRDSKLN